MIPHTMTDALNELWDATRHNNQRMRVARVHEKATDESVFTLSIVDHHNHTLIKVTTKTLESAARWILDNHGRTRRR